MKKTTRNQNMTNQRLRGDETGNTGSLPLNDSKSGREPERFQDKNLDQPGDRNVQRYDDYTGTVENRPG